MELSVKYIQLNKILTGENGRGKDLPNIPELANSILAYGVVSPITVQQSPVSGYYDLISGYRRYAALKLIEEKGEESQMLRVKDGSIMVPAIPYPETGLKDLELQVLYNQYIEWPLYMRIVAANQLWVQHGYTQSQIANIFGLNRQTVAQYVALAKSHKLLFMLGAGELNDLSLHTLYHIALLLDGPDCQGDKQCEDTIIKTLQALRDAGMSLSWAKIEPRLRAALGHVEAVNLPGIEDVGSENIFGTSFAKELPLADILEDETKGFQEQPLGGGMSMLDTLTHSLENDDLEGSFIAPSSMPMNYQKMLLALKTLGNIHAETDREIGLVTNTILALDRIIRNPTVNLSVPEMRILILKTITQYLK